MKLLIDIGNTRLKWQLHEDANNYASGALLHDGVHEHAEKLWQTLPLEGVWIASVGLSACKDELTEQMRAYGHTVHLVQSADVFNGLNNAYEQPETLGVDRWLGLVAAHSSNAGDVLVVSAGTALTLDIVDSKGVHQGGMIAPGLSLMRRSLHERTASLPLVTSCYQGLGKNTEHAIAGGTLMASVAVIEKIFRQYQQQYPTLTVVLCGGNAQLMHEYLDDSVKVHARVEDDWLFRGLLAYAQNIQGRGAE